MFDLADLGEVRLHYSVTGPENGPAVVFAHALGTDMRIWDGVIARLPEGLRVLRFDMRGHGLSSAPEGPYYMGDLVEDAAKVMEHVGMKDALFVGLSIGGVIAQGLASERLDLLRAIVLSHTAAKIGTHQTWHQRIHLVEDKGIEAVAEATLERWFARGTRRERPLLVEAIGTMLRRSSLTGYLGCMEALSETDLVESTARLRVPTLGIASTEDGSTPPDLVRETVDSIPGSKFELMRRTGHLACVEDPEAYAALITTFLREIGHQIT